MKKEMKERDPYGAVPSAARANEPCYWVAATQLSEEWLADVVVGAGCSGASIGAQEILIFEQHPQISFASTSS
eukprot:gene19717-23588_t